MPKYIVPKYCEMVQFVEIEAECKDDAYDLAHEHEYDDRWSEWEPRYLGSEKVDFDLIEKVEDDD